MTDSVWYFARGDVEHGPVNVAQIKALAAAGKLRADDLVWKDGMDDWVPAGEVPEIFAKDKGTKAAAPAKKKEDPKEKKAEPVVEKKQQPREPVKAKALPSLSGPIEPLKFIFPLSQPLLIVGFLLVLFSRGCDSLGDRYAARLSALSQVAEAQFNDRWDSKRAALVKRRADLQNQAIKTPDDARRMQEIAEELTQLDADRNEEEQELRRGRWSDLQSNSRDALASHRMWSFWREGVFWFGTLVFSAALMSIGFSGQGPERWLCLVILAIITFALYVGYAATP